MRNPLAIMKRLVEKRVIDPAAPFDPPPSFVQPINNEIILSLDLIDAAKVRDGLSYAACWIDKDEPLAEWYRKTADKLHAEIEKRQ